MPKKTRNIFLKSKAEVRIYSNCRVAADVNNGTTMSIGEQLMRGALPGFKDAVVKCNGRHTPTCCVRFDVGTGREVGPCEPVTSRGRRAALRTAAQEGEAAFKDVAQTIDYVLVRAGGEAGAAPYDLQLRDASVDPSKEAGPGFESISDHAGVRVVVDVHPTVHAPTRVKGGAGGRRPADATRHANAHAAAAAATASSAAARTPGSPVSAQRRSSPTKAAVASEATADDCPPTQASQYAAKAHTAVSSATKKATPTSR